MLEQRRLRPPFFWRRGSFTLHDFGARQLWLGQRVVIGLPDREHETERGFDRPPRDEPEHDRKHTEVNAWPVVGPAAEHRPDAELRDDDREQNCQRATKPIEPRDPTSEFLELLV